MPTGIYQLILWQALADHFWREGVPMAEDAVMAKQLANQHEVFALQSATKVG
ncbi:MAG: hypothetical protein WBA90_07440 [Albidovulum sp.]